MNKKLWKGRFCEENVASLATDLSGLPRKIVTVDESTFEKRLLDALTFEIFQPHAQRPNMRELDNIACNRKEVFKLYDKLFRQDWYTRFLTLLFGNWDDS